jgi:hypothetical protein
MTWDKVITKNLGKGEGWVGFFSYVSKELFLWCGGGGMEVGVFFFFLLLSKGEWEECLKEGGLEFFLIFQMDFSLGGMGNGEVWLFLKGERGRAKHFQKMLNY